MERWREACGVRFFVRDDDRFFATRARFAAWAAGRRRYRMEDFYREMRRETGLLMREGEPEGGRWNFDAENRKRLPKGCQPPPLLRFAPDAVTREVLALVGGALPIISANSTGFGWATSRERRVTRARAFPRRNLAGFRRLSGRDGGGRAVPSHAVISPYLNVGLLSRAKSARAPKRLCAGRGAAQCGRRLHPPDPRLARICARHLLAKRPDYGRSNALRRRRPLPSFYWTGKTEMRCIAEAVGETRRHAYAHHILRLMVTGNFALLAGLNPAEVEDWYLCVYADAYDWVELPNTHGMALFADGGLLASKPYAASGAYIDRMSDFCARLPLRPEGKSGPDACPFNPLYWNFLIEIARVSPAMSGSRCPIARSRR